MKILLVDDDADFREALATLLVRWNHEVIQAENGEQATDMFRRGVYDVIITDASMPGLTGLDLCRAVRSLARESYTYIVMLTARGGVENLVEALDAGADDFLTKPFDRQVLAARLRVAARILDLRAHVKRLEGILSICSHCKRVRRDDGSWAQLESYFQDRSDLRFSHGICSDCVRVYYPMQDTERSGADRSPATDNDKKS